MGLSHDTAKGATNTAIINIIVQNATA